MRRQRLSTYSRNFSFWARRCERMGGKTGLLATICGGSTIRRIYRRSHVPTIVDMSLECDPKWTHLLLINAIWKHIAVASLDRAHPVVSARMPQQRTRFDAGRGESSKCQIEMDIPCKRPANTSVQSSLLVLLTERQSRCPIWARYSDQKKKNFAWCEMQIRMMMNWTCASRMWFVVWGIWMGQCCVGMWIAFSFDFRSSRSSIFFVLLHCRIFIVFHTTHTSPIGIYRYIHLLDNGISTFLYCTSLITLWRTEYLHTARLSIGSTSYIRNPWWFMFHAEAFFYKCPLSRSSVKQLLGSDVPLFLDNMSMIAMVFVTCNRPTAILLWHRKVIAGWPVFAHQSPMSVGVLFGIKNAPYLEGV